MGVAHACSDLFGLLAPWHGRRPALLGVTSFQAEDQPDPTLDGSESPDETPPEETTPDSYMLNQVPRMAGNLDMGAMKQLVDMSKSVIAEMRFKLKNLEEEAKGRELNAKMGLPTSSLQISLADCPLSTADA